METNLSRRLFVVIHALSTEEYSPQALPHVMESVKIAFEEGAHGVFLIPDYVKGYAKATRFDLAKYYHFLYEKYKNEKDFRIGLNFLLPKHGYGTGEFLEKFISKPNIQMLQMDYISSEISKHYYPDTEIFGSFAFKYSPEENAQGKELEVLTCLAKKYCDVPTTSGSATGSAASIEKIKEIRYYLGGGSRLGLASGVSIENIKSFLDAGATDFLVATSLIKETRNKMDILDPKAVKSLVKAVRSYK